MTRTEKDREKACVCVSEGIGSGGIGSPLVGTSPCVVIYLSRVAYYYRYVDSNAKGSRADISVAARYREVMLLIGTRCVCV